MIIGIGHVAYLVNDMAASLDFYVAKLGLTHAFSINRDDKPWIEYLKVVSGQFIELFYTEAGFENVQNAYSHLCLCVDDIQAIAQQMRNKGVEITAGPSEGKDGNWQCWVKDPDGNRIEFMQISPESKQAQS